MKTIKIFFTLLACISLTGNVSAAQESWDILDKSMAAWNVDGGAATNKAWTSSQAGSGISVTQGSGFVNIKKTGVAANNNYAFLIPPALTLSSNTAYTFEVKARVQPTDKTTYPDNQTNFESNQISARLNAKNIAIHLKYGDENTGYISIGGAMSHEAASKYTLNTSEWHRYRFVFHSGNTTYDVYVDDGDEPVFENVTATGMSGSNILRLGAETAHRCNMDIEHAKMGTGDLASKPKITSVALTSDSHVANGAHPPVTATVATAMIDNGEKLLLSLVDELGAEVVTPVEITVNGNEAASLIDIPSSLPIGKYAVKAAAPNGLIGDVAITPQSAQYVVADVSPIEAKMFPQVKPVGWAVADIDDYTYKGPSNEFVFPSIIDTKQYTVNGKFLNNEEPLARYYLFYTPHENPGGVYLATSDSLDGPWTEYDGTAGMSPGTVMDFAWAASQSDIINNGAERHISGCQVFWNTVYNKYFIYFHGPNTTTHYATSDNMLNWTYGADILTGKHFSPVGAECSYAKCFEYEIPGLGNKYVMLLMNQENQVRRIYWAHSTNGVNWTPITRPLVSPDLHHKKIPGTTIKPNYTADPNDDGTPGYPSSMGKNNVAAPYLMVRDGRYFVICHGSSGNMFAVEVGEKFDMEVHWGIYQDHNDFVIDTDASGDPVAVSRIAAPSFMQDDNGKWYMFFEAGGRVGGNIAYAKEADDNAPAMLTSLSCGAGILSPAFNPDITEYTCTLLSGTESITPVITVSFGAEATGVEAIDVSSGSGTATIEVTSPNGASGKTYTINFVTGNGADYTDRIINSDFELAYDAGCNPVPVIADMDGWSNSAWRPKNTSCAQKQFYGWTCDLSLTGNSTSQGINADANGKHGDWICWIGGNSGGSSQHIEFEFSQTIDNLPAGTYKVQCLLAVGSGNKKNNQRLFANSNALYYGKPSDYVSNLVAGENQAFAGHTSFVEKDLKGMTLYLTIGNGEQLKTGIRTSNMLGNGTTTVQQSPMFKTDYFRLTKIDDACAADASLARIVLSTGTLNFSPEEPAYQVLLPAGTETVTAFATANRQGATVAGAGAVDVSSGAGVSTITVTALNGTATKTYTVNYTVGSNTAIGAVAAVNPEKSVQYITLTGIVVPATAKGLLLKKTTYTDGSVKVEKIINR
jgi:hypothetical protein